MALDESFRIVGALRSTPSDRIFEAAVRRRSCGVQVRIFRRRRIEVLAVLRLLRWAPRLYGLAITKSPSPVSGRSSSRIRRTCGDSGTRTLDLRRTP